MIWLATNAIASLLLPPGSLLLLAAVGWSIAARRPKLGRSVVGVALIALYVLATPYVSDRLLQRLEPVPRDPLAQPGVQAIVVLGGDAVAAAPEYGTDTVDAQTLTRLRYAARLYRATRKPILVTGGSPDGVSPAAAGLMKSALNLEFHVPVAWVEEKAKTTLDNARLSRGLLARAGIRRIWLVTHAWHMRRAVMAFEESGFTVVPAPTAFTAPRKLSILSFLPRARALRNSSRFFHEIIGLAWYRIRFLAGR